MDRIDLKDENLATKVVRVLQSGGLVMHPTETCYGFAVDVSNESALQKLYALKGRDANKPVSILVSDLNMAKEYGDFSGKALELVRHFWPGPLTIIVPRSARLPEFFNPGDEFVGIRCSGDIVCRAMVEKFGGSVTTTSANLSGSLPLYEADVTSFGELAANIDLLVDGRRLNENKPSTVVKVVGNELQILRQGDLYLGDYI